MAELRSSDVLSKQTTMNKFLATRATDLETRAADLETLTTKWMWLNQLKHISPYIVSGRIYKPWTEESGGTYVFQWRDDLEKQVMYGLFQYLRRSETSMGFLFLTYTYSSGEGAMSYCVTYPTNITYNNSGSATLAFANGIQLHFQNIGDVSNITMTTTSTGWFNSKPQPMDLKILLCDL